MRMICLEPAHVSGPNQADSLCRVAKQRNWLLRNSTRTFTPVSIVLSDVRDHNPLLGYRRLWRLLEIASVFKSLDEGRGLRTKSAHLEVLPNPPVPMNPEISGSLPNRCPKGPACHSHTPWGGVFGYMRIFQSFMEFHRPFLAPSVRPFRYHRYLPLELEEDEEQKCAVFDV